MKYIKVAMDVFLCAVALWIVYQETGYATTILIAVLLFTNIVTVSAVSINQKRIKIFLENISNPKIVDDANDVINRDTK